MINFKRNKKNIFGIFLAVLILGLGIYYIKNNINNVEENEIVKKDLRKCFILKDEKRARTVIYEEKEIGGKKMIKGSDTFSNLEDETKEVYDFVASIDGKFMDAFGQNKEGVMEERIYRVYKNGLVEGLVNIESGRKEVVDNGITYSLIADRDSIKYDGKYAILKINCKEITE